MIMAGRILWEPYCFGQDFITLFLRVPDCEETDRAVDPEGVAAG